MQFFSQTFLCFILFFRSLGASKCLPLPTVVKYLNTNETVLLPTMRIELGTSDAGRLHSAITKILIEERLGYNVTFWPTNSYSDYAYDMNQTFNRMGIFNYQGAFVQGLIDDEYDIILDLWINENVPSLTPPGSPEDVGGVGSVGQLGWYIPNYILFDNPEFVSWQGLYSTKAQHLFQNTLYVSDPRYTLTKNSIQMIKNFGLNYTVTPLGSDPDLFNLLKTRYENKQPILFCTWYPQGIFKQYDLTRVSLPPNPCWCFQTNCFRNLTCDFPLFDIDKLVNYKLRERAKQVYSFVQLYRMRRDQVEQMLSDLSTTNSTIGDIACAWVKSNVQIWRKWIVPTNFTTCIPGCQHGNCTPGYDDIPARCECDVGWSGDACDQSTSAFSISLSTCLLLVNFFVGMASFIVIFSRYRMPIVNFLGQPLLILMTMICFLFMHTPILNRLGILYPCRVLAWFEGLLFPFFLISVFVGLLRYKFLCDFIPLKAKLASSQLKTNTKQIGLFKKYVFAKYSFLCAIFLQLLVVIIEITIYFNGEPLPQDRGCALHNKIIWGQIALITTGWFCCFAALQVLPSKSLVIYRTETVYLLLYGSCCSILYFAINLRATTLETQYLSTYLLWSVPMIYQYRTIISPALPKYFQIFDCAKKGKPKDDLPGNAFNDVLGTSQGSEVFLYYCREEITDQNLYAWQAIELFKKKPTIQGLEEFYEKYIAYDAPLKIDIPYRMREKIRHTVATKGGDFVLDSLETCLDAIQAEVYHIMLITSWPRFRSTHAYEIFAQSMIRARDDALEVGEAKSVFLANMSHEIRTPLNGVLGLARVVLETRLSEDQRDLLTTIVDSGKQLLTVINDILDFSKLESGKITLENVRYFPLSAVENTICMFARMAKEKGIDLVCHVVDGYVQHAFGDVTRIRQILTNLVGNAVKFTYCGQVVVTIDMTHKWSSKKLLYFSVRDSGIGILRSRKHKLFQPFVQQDASDTRKFGGSGLGLVICKKLVEAQGGAIWVESQRDENSDFSEKEEGPGSTFHVTIPNQNIEDDEETEILRLCTPLHQKKILIIDKETSGAAIAAFLGRYCVAVTTAPSLDASLIFFQEKDTPELGNENSGYDYVIVLESLLPSYPGLNCEQLPRDAKLILLTWNFTSELQRNAFSAGFSAVLSKPIRRHHLLRVLLPRADWPQLEMEMEEDLDDSIQKNNVVPSSPSQTSLNLSGKGVSTSQSSTMESLPLISTRRGSEPKARSNERPPGQIQPLRYIVVDPFEESGKEREPDDEQEDTIFSHPVSVPGSRRSPKTKSQSIELLAKYSNQLSSMIALTSSNLPLSPTITSPPASFSAPSISSIVHSQSPTFSSPSPTSMLSSYAPSLPSPVAGQSLNSLLSVSSFSSSSFSSSSSSSSSSPPLSSSSLSSSSLSNHTLDLLSVSAPNNPSTWSPLFSSTRYITSPSLTIATSAPSSSSSSPSSSSLSSSAFSFSSGSDWSPLFSSSRYIKSASSSSSISEAFSSSGASAENGNSREKKQTEGSMQRKRRGPNKNKNKDLGQRCPLKLLVVEDNLINQKVVKRMLLHYGYDCEVANDGIEAIEKLKAQPFDVLFMDIQMPRMGGLEASKIIRSTLPSNQQPVIVALTANVLPDEKARCVEAGMDDFLSKPLELNALEINLIKQYTRIQSTRTGKPLNDPVPTES